MKNNRFRGFWLVLLIISFSSSIVVWADEPTKLEKCKIRFAYWRLTSEPQNTIMKEIVKKFTDANPQVTVELDPISHTQILDQFTIQSIGGDAPDVVIVPFQNVPKFVQMGFVHPLTEYLKNDPKFLDQFYDFLIPMMTINGQVYGVPHDIASSTLYYNKKLFREAGLPDTPPTNYAEFLKDAKALSKPNIGQYGFGLSGTTEASNQSRWYSMFWASGTALVDPADEKTVLLDTKEGIAAFKRIVELFTVNHVCTPSPVDLGYNDMMTLFANGKLGMMQQNIGAAVAITKANPNLEFGIAPFVWEDYGITKEGAMAFISQSSKHKDVAWAFLKHLVSFESIRDWSIPLNYLPPRKDIGKLKEVQGNPVISTYLNNILPHATMFTRLTQNESVWNVFFREVTLALQGKNVEKAAKDAAVDMRKIINGQ